MTVILGSGLAGTRLAKNLDAAWSRSGSREPLVVFGEQGPFDRMALGEWAAGRQPWPAIEAGPVRAQTQFITRTVTDVSLSDRTLVDDSGTVWTWDRLVFATGAEPMIPPCFARHSDAVAIASVEGAEALRSRLPSSKEVLVVGGGPLGLETAWNLRLEGHEVTLAHRGPRLLEPFLDAEASDAVAEQWRNAGIDLRLNSSEIGLAEGSGLEVTFGNGDRWQGPLVVLTCGTKPRTDLARKAGLVVGDRGIAVDLAGRTSAAGVWAVGDCACPPPGMLGGLWATARASADRLSEEWTGVAGSQQAAVVPFRLKVDWPVIAWGNPQAPDHLPEVRASRRGAMWKAVGNPGTLAFWQILGPWEALEARVADLEAGRIQLEPSIEKPSRWPDSHVVCDCHGLDAGTVRRAWATAKDLADLGRSSAAGTSCGSCRARLLALKNKPLNRRELWSRAYHRARWQKWSWADLVGYTINYGMMISGLLTIVTGILKMPGWMEALGLDQRSLPDEANMALSALLDLHDWPGVILTVLALVHVMLHWGMMWEFLASWFRKRPKETNPRGTAEAEPRQP